MIHDYKDLIVWQKSMDLVVLIYELTSKFPDLEKFGLISQMRRCAISIPSNIAEGRRRSTKKDYSSFLHNAYGSGAELETQIEISKRLGYGDKISYNKIDGLLLEVMKILNAMIYKMNNLKS